MLSQATGEGVREKSWTSWPCCTRTWPRAGLLTTSCLLSSRLAGWKLSREQGLCLSLADTKFSINDSVDADSFQLSQAFLLSFSPSLLPFLSHSIAQAGSKC